MVIFICLPMKGDVFAVKCDFCVCRERRFTTLIKRKDKTCAFYVFFKNTKYNKKENGI